MDLFILLNAHLHFTMRLFFLSGNFPPPDKKNPRGIAAGERLATKQAKGKSHASAWLLLVAETGLEPATSGL